MSNLTDKITNPEALKLIADFKSGALLAPIKAKIILYKWYLISGGVVVFLLIALAIGKAIFRGSEAPIFLPPDIGIPSPTIDKTFNSSYEPVRQNILNFGTDLPDPVIPAFDNVIDLESVNI